MHTQTFMQNIFFFFLIFWYWRRNSWCLITKTPKIKSFQSSGFSSSWSLLFILFELNVLIRHPRRAYRAKCHFSTDEAVLCLWPGKIWMQGLQLAWFSTAGIPSASVVKDGKPARACFPIKQAALWLAEQITTGESECSRTSIQTNQLPAEIVFFFLPHFLPVAFALIFYFLFPFPSRKTLALSYAKTNFYFYFYFF